MLLPEENIKGYAANSFLNETKLANFRNVKFLLAHGEADGECFQNIFN